MNLRLPLCSLCFLLLLPLQQLVLGQAWHPFPAGQVSLFKFSEGIGLDSALMGARIDSVALEGQDSAFYLYRIARPVWQLEYNCNGGLVQNGAHATNRDHYLGQKLLRAPNGDCRFILSNGDSFALRTWAPVGDRWEWQLGDTATVDSITFRSVLGVMDSVKHFSTQGGKMLALSRSMGLVSAPNLYPFHLLYLGSTIDVQFDLWGIPTLSLGGRLPTYAEVGQMDVGDRVGYHHSNHSATYGTSTFYINCTVTAPIPGQRFSYSAVCDTLRIITPIQTNIPDSTYHPAGPQVLSIDSLNTPDLSLLPYDDGPNDGSGIVQAGAYLINGSAGRVRSKFRLLYNWDDCSQAYLVQPVYISQRSFGTGLMQVSERYMSSNINSGYDVYCYQKGAETWGTCLDLGTLIGVTPGAGLDFRVSPNPASSTLRVELPDGMTLVAAELMGMDGRVVTSADGGANGTEINVTGVASGRYMLRVRDAAGQVGFQRVLVER
ncbi:MAG: T9SS type A sorting domain-containing protein [Bacteroidia bacterium]